MISPLFQVEMSDSGDRLLLVLLASAKAPPFLKSLFPEEGTVLVPVSRFFYFRKMYSSPCSFIESKIYPN